MYDTPIMTDAEALICNFKTDTQQEADGVFLGDKDPLRNSSTYKCYAPKYGPLTYTEKQQAHLVAQAYYNKFPESVANVQITPPGVIKYYMEKRLPYSSSVPFTNYYKKRLQLYQAGWDEVFCHNVYKKFKTGGYKMFFHGFLKAQVVPKLNPSNNIVTNAHEFLLDDSKPIRSVEMVQMPLNQNMQILFEKGGLYFEADAHEFDSRTDKFTGNVQLLQRNQRVILKVPSDIINDCK
ncbi:17228_t:CDS:2, partial [Racocetra persica]